jgi:hypothetical protein
MVDRVGFYYLSAQFAKLNLIIQAKIVLVAKLFQMVVPLVVQI